MDVAAIKSQIENQIPGISLKLIRDTLWIENPQDVFKVAHLLKESPEYQMDYLSSLTGADYLQYLEVVYHLYSMKKKIGPLVLRVRVSRDSLPVVPPLVGADPRYPRAYVREGESPWPRSSVVAHEHGESPSPAGQALDARQKGKVPDRKSTRLNSSHSRASRMPSSA